MIEAIKKSNFAVTKFGNRLFIIDDDGLRQFVTNMVGPQEDNSSSLCIVDTEQSEHENMRHDFRDGSMPTKYVDWRRSYYTARLRRLGCLWRRWLYL